MKGRKRAQRRAAQRAAKHKKHYQMTAETGRFPVAGRSAERWLIAPRADLSDRINRMTPEEQKQFRHYLKKIGLEHLAPPPKRRGRPKKPKPE